MKNVAKLVFWSFLLSLTCLGSTSDPATASTNQLAFDLYPALRFETNVTFSPLSISTALAMTYAGAQGQTAVAMKHILHYQDNDQSFHESFGKLAKTLVQNNDDNTSLKISNNLWMQQDLLVLDNFKKMLGLGYGVKPQALDFKNQPSLSTATINQAISEQTNGEISKLLKEDLKNDTRLLLTNALYFKASWQKPFTASMTREANFKKLDNSEVPASFMGHVKYYLYSEDDTRQVVMVPYANEDYSAVFVLPREGQLRTVEGTMNPQQFEGMLSGLVDQKVDLSLPKFSQRTSPHLKRVLADRGLELLFDQDESDLSGINGIKYGDNKLYVSDVLHEAVVKMDEAGTTAAAATSVNIAIPTSMPIEDEKIVNFHADRPFLFYIIHVPTKTILFMGRVDEPNAP